MCRPYGTQMFLSAPPGTSVPGYPMPPLRGWRGQHQTLRSAPSQRLPGLPSRAILCRPFRAGAVSTRRRGQHQTSRTAPGIKDQSTTAKASAGAVSTRCRHRTPDVEGQSTTAKASAGAMHVRIWRARPSTKSCRRRSRRRFSVCRCRSRLRLLRLRCESRARSLPARCAPSR